MSEKILIRNADAIVTCDDADRVLYHSDILLSGGRIEAVGRDLSAGGAQVFGDGASHDAQTDHADFFHEYLSFAQCPGVLGGHEKEAGPGGLPLMRGTEKRPGWHISNTESKAV